MKKIYVGVNLMKYTITKLDANYIVEFYRIISFHDMGWNSIKLWKI